MVFTIPSELPYLFSNNDSFCYHDSSKPWNYLHQWINDHATRTTRMTRNSWSTMCRGGGSKVSLKLWSRSFPMRDSISCSNFSKASANAGWVVRNLQGFATIMFHFHPFLLEETEKQHLKQRLSRRCRKPAPIGCSSTSSSLQTRA